VTAEHRSWTLLTNHGRILLMLARDQDARLRDLADEAGITERSVQAIISDLEASGYVTKHRVGRRNSYKVNRRRPFRHSAESGHQVGELLDLFATE
jgi:DNA-binding MarR family transcriptional regulator